MICRTYFSQESVIAPTLFNVHINDLGVGGSLPGYFQIRLRTTTKYNIVQNDGYSNIQEPLNTVNEWAAMNKMQLNSEKN